MKKITRAAEIFCHVFNIICMAAAAVMMVAVFADVIMRFVFTRPIRGITELAQCCFVLMTAAFGVCVLEKAHTAVDVFTVKMKPQVRRIAMLIVNAVSVVYCFVVGWRTILSAISSAESYIMYVMLDVKEWPFIAVYGAALIVAGIATIIFAINEWIEDTNAYKASKLNGGAKPAVEETNEEG